jgi:MoxR-like ATPase
MAKVRRQVTERRIGLTRTPIFLIGDAGVWKSRIFGKLAEKEYLLFLLRASGPTDVQGGVKKTQQTPTLRPSAHAVS